MDQKDLEKNPKGLPEALHPEIGNGASWESDPNDFNLRTVDPSKSLDQFLLDTDTEQKFVERWNTQLIQPASGDSFQGSNDQQPIPYVPKEDLKGKRKDKKIRGNKPEEGVKPDWFENLEEELNLVEDPNKPKEPESFTPNEYSPAVQPEGKRVRKAVKKAQKEVKPPKSTSKSDTNNPLEANLSPFTKWLKSLKGSEYVHPYEDDYALGKLSISGQEGISETFADLLANQGYKDRAIEMYKLLMAKNPEKSSFFAAKIEALK